MIISVASGKGGTGKTTVATSLALALDDVQFLDCDVEEPNAGVFLASWLTGREDAVLLMPQVDETACNWCGRCQEVCAFNALAVIPPVDGGSGKVLRFDSLCHGCGACSRLCPRNAITDVPEKIGRVDWGIAHQDGSPDLDFVQGTLDIGQSLSPPVIQAVKRHLNQHKTVIIDAPPGTSCPVIEAIDGSDYCILVTEPTPFGLHDLALAVELLGKMEIPFGVVINRSNDRNQAVERFCAERNIPILFRIPYKREIAEAYSRGIPLVELSPEYRGKFRAVFESLCRTPGEAAQVRTEGES